jgi:NAD(P)H-hydrate epimerase
MKILTAEQIRKADQYTIQHEPISSINLMERAATQCVRWLMHNSYSPLVALSEDTRANQVIKIFAGTGNNGGDGLVIGRQLLLAGFTKVQVFIVCYSEKFSEDCQANIDLFTKASHAVTDKAENNSLIYIHEEKDLPHIHPSDIVIDAIFGSGLNKSISGFTARLIEQINLSKAVVIAIDIPSGLFAENNEDIDNNTVIIANHTLTFEVFKLAFLYDQNYTFTGRIHLLKIGLDGSFLNQLTSNQFIITKGSIKLFFKKRHKIAHKGNFGHALLVVGSEGKVGAGVLAAKACMRAGVGLLSVHTPKCGYAILQTTIPEAMTLVDKKKKYISQVFKDIGEYEKYTSVGIGCGIGKNPKTAQALYEILKLSSKPMVIDADALNILSENPTWWEIVPKHSILTPHPKEFERLFGRTTNPYLRHQLQLAMSVQRQVFIILKGATTCITTPEGNTYFNITGNAGMATGGSGDVLTGILTSLLAQGYSGEQTCRLGVFLHGTAGNIAAKKYSQEAMIAGDIIEYLGKAMKKIAKDNKSY